MGRRVAVVGAGGQLGRELVREFSEAGHSVIALSRPDFDITRRGDVQRLTAMSPEVVINSAAWTDVDGCARDPARAMEINGVAAGAVASAGAAAGALIVQISTNEVFDGTLERPYVEDDDALPVNPYGASKLAGERLVARATPRHLIVRTAWLYTPTGNNFATKIRAAAQRARESGLPLKVVDDEWGNPTPAAWLAAAVLRIVGLLERGSASPGRYHLAGWPPVTRYGWAVTLVDGGPGAVVPVSLADYPRDSVVPPRAVLDISRARSLGIEPADWRMPLGSTAATDTVRDRSGPAGFEPAI
jgi:dTDP-4-dehydrorhamnose reductase